MKSRVNTSQLISDNLQSRILSVVIPAVCLFLSAWPAKSQGIITTIAGNGTMTFAGDGGLATAASLNQPTGLAMDVAGNVYISDTNNWRVRLVSPTGMISTVAGNGIDGATGASLSDAYGLAVDAARNLYIADASNRRIQRVTSAGIVTTIAGTGIQGSSGDGGLAIYATLNRPVAVTIDTTGNLYICDSSNHAIRRVNLASGIITKYAGNGVPAFSGDGGQAIAASLQFPLAVAMDKSGNLYIADAGNNCIRKVTQAGVISTVAGNGNRAGFAGDGAAAIGALLNIPSDVTVDGSGSLYIADSGNNRVRRVDGTSGIISTIAGGANNGFSGDGGPAISSLLNFPWGIAVDATGAIYIADHANNRIRKISGSASTLTTSPSTIAPNTWVAINATGLSLATESRTWQGADFVSSTMPTQLDGISVAVNGQPAFVSYISPSQVNILTPPDAMQGAVPVQFALNGAPTVSLTAQAQLLSPLFFVFGGGPYVAATHANGSFIGPASLYPGLTTPAKPGESVVLYANGFGTTSTPVVRGSLTQSGSLLLFPVITINGQPAAVQFAGLVAPGEFQFNIIVPASLGDGDQSITATYGGLTTQVGTLITIQH
ncbi:MAG: hypothetical protein P4L56_31540 [Candidatus Sulfopaludibacter sp.]|nr:hypothetical protein [Candidatus Sulfopaludibacter sp.]